MRDLFPGKMVDYLYRGKHFSGLFLMKRDKKYFFGSGSVTPVSLVKIEHVYPDIFSGVRINENLTVSMARYRRETAGPVSSGEVMIKIVGDMIYFVPVFYDSRRNMYISKEGAIMNLSIAFVVDSGYRATEFELSAEGIEKMKQAYPADI